MAIENGSAFLLKIGNGAAPPAYATVAGLRTTQLSVNGEAVNVTTKDSGGWRELLSGAGVRSVSVSAAGSHEGWRGADLWLVAATGSEAIAMGRVRPAAALGVLTEPVGGGSAHLFDLDASLLVSLANAAMTLESVEDPVLLAGANRAMVGTELIQFGVAEAVGEGLWRLSRLLRGRGGTNAAGGHAAGASFVLLNDAALFAFPDDVAPLAGSGGAVLQWASHADVTVTDVAISLAGAALRPLAPVHGRMRPDGAGGVNVAWVRRSRADTGWRDGVDLPPGEARERWWIETVPPVPGAGPWETDDAALYIDAASMAAIPPGTALSICMAGDFALSPPLFIPLA